MNISENDNSLDLDLAIELSEFFRLSRGRADKIIKEDVAPCSVAWATELQNEIGAIGTAVSIYSMDPNDANCNMLKAAYQDYLDALRPYGNCSTLSGTSRTEWQNALNEAESDLDTLC